MEVAQLSNSNDLLMNVGENVVFPSYSCTILLSSFLCRIFIVFVPSISQIRNTLIVEYVPIKMATMTDNTNDRERLETIGTLIRC